MTIIDVDTAAVHELLGRWWFNYDEGNFDVLAQLLTDDAHFTCRTDTGTTDYEEFVRCDLRGRDEVMAWQTDHRSNSPYPLRHNCTNVSNDWRFSRFSIILKISSSGRLSDSSKMMVAS